MTLLFPTAKPFGTVDSWRETMWVTIAMFVAILAYKFAENIILGMDAPPFNWLEFIGTWFGLITVWLARTQNILSWPTGLICVLCLGIFFVQIDLLGQAFLNLAFFSGVSIYGWYNWTYGGRVYSLRRMELPVTDLDWPSRFTWLGMTVLVSALCWISISYIAPWSQYPLLDATVVGSSIVAQYLLAEKKVESWWLWLGPVNALSIILFAMSGAYTVMALYIAFFIHAAFAIKSWKDNADVRI